MTKSRDIADSTKTLDVDGGTIKLDGNYPVGTANVALGNNALSSATSANDSIAVGDNALLNNTSGSDNTAVGTSAMKENTTGSNNSAYGVLALDDNTTGASNVGVGHGALRFNTTASNNTAVGYQSLLANTTGQYNSALGRLSLDSNTTGSENVAIGNNALQANTTASNNVAVGSTALFSNTTASSNTAVGYQAGYLNTTAEYNTYIGHQAGDANTKAGANTFVGNNSGGSFNRTETGNTFNTFIGCDAGSLITTGKENTIIGAFDGNQGGLDIRTSSNNIVLSDGDGNPRMYYRSAGSAAWIIGNQTAETYWPATTSVANNNAIFLEGSAGTLGVTTSNSPFYLNKNNGDGILVALYSEGNFEGNISVSGSTVSYNGGHLARWSQFADGSKDNTLVKGTVMTNLDQMCVWEHGAIAVGDTIKNAVGEDMVATADDVADAYTEINEQLNCMAVSSVEGDPNVSGVFVNWDSTDDEYNDLNIAMTGDMIIRIAQGTTVARGDLLMSAGDGTAKPQGDDIVRSKTIAKVTSTHVSNTYDDGSYCVPCVLMAC